MKISVILGATLAVLIALITFSPTDGPGAAQVLAGSSLPGDANCDSVVNAIDAALVLQFNAGLLSTAPCPDNADADGDGVVNSIDAALILQFTAGLATSLGPSQPPTDTPLGPTNTLTPQPTAEPSATPGTAVTPGQPTETTTLPPAITPMPPETATPTEAAPNSIPTVTILAPEEGAGLSLNQKVTLMGTATDPQQPITYEWRIQLVNSDTETVIGIGEDLSWTPSDHVLGGCGSAQTSIILYATDGGGKTGSASVLVEIIRSIC